MCARERPVRAILVAKTKEEYQKLLERVKRDPRSEKELWYERLGCQPGRTPSLTKIVTPKNFFQEVTKARKPVALDV